MTKTKEVKMSDQEIQVEDLSTEKKFFTQIPNIIIRMGLGPYALSYYLVLKSIAGDKTCFMKAKNLAELVGCSTRQLRRLNAILSKPFEALNGKPLIKISYRKDSNGESQPNVIQIVDIWVENIDALRSDKPIAKTKIPKQKTKTKEKNSVDCESGGVDCESRGADCGADIIRTIEGDDFKENDINVRDRSFDESQSIVSFDPKTYILPNGQNLSLRMQRSLAKYTGKDREKILANVQYFHDLIKKGQKFDNPESYLQACIKNNYAASRSNSEQNDLYARFIKESENPRGLKILKTVIQMDKFNGEPPISLSKTLPHASFCSALDNYVLFSQEHDL